MGFGWEDAALLVTRPIVTKLLYVCDRIFGWDVPHRALMDLAGRPGLTRRGSLGFGDL